MRLLIYLLALVSGFSAAEAARAEVVPASSIAQAAVAAAEALASEGEQLSSRPADDWLDNSPAFLPQEAWLALATPTPVSYHDITRE